MKQKMCWMKKMAARLAAVMIAILAMPSAVLAAPSGSTGGDRRSIYIAIIILLTAAVMALPYIRRKK